MTNDALSSALIDTCVHCGFCLPTCPTYLLWGEEMDSPRGRIYLMKAGIEGRAEMTSSFVEHFDRCLGCLACVTACPSGVQYAPLIEKQRAQSRAALCRAVQPTECSARCSWPSFRIRGACDWRCCRCWSSVRCCGGSSGVRSRLGRGGSRPEATDGGLWQRVTAAIALAPPVTWRSLIDTMPEHTPAVGSERLKVALLAGCVQRLSFAKVNHATVRVLAAEGCGVHAPGRPGLLRRAAAARRPHRAGARARPPQHRGLRGGRRGSDRGERRGLWVGDEGVRRAVRRRSGLGRTGRGDQREGPGRDGTARRAR